MTSCPSCHAELPAGTRWCTICATNVIDPTIGRLASPGKRLGAYVLDFVFPIAAWVFVFVAAGIQHGFWGILALIVMIGYPIWALITFAKGTSPGKQLLGMFVVKQDGRRAGFGTMLVREWIGKVLSGLLFSLGYLWILFDRERQGWHDKLASTYVVERAPGT
ncbi:RDD family protein [Carboxydochorda subterranea]|uniref:RDD family protein n=1 Tax=Carboxydichorda subterranea TaxID=3109565 RepID=A0ABZ1C0V9_9FIRM|nr:RDD family protein [Limnochorda sp. L945t]WRP17953.1 RDD family protein [Limnochorda sp. L945t]